MFNGRSNKVFISYIVKINTLVFEILVRVGRPGTPSPTPNFVRIAQGDFSLGLIFFTKN